MRVSSVEIADVILLLDFEGGYEHLCVNFMKYYENMYM